ncbi:MAG: hypothetical protein C4321_08570 [Chloroflexota bacterium]
MFSGSENNSSEAKWTRARAILDLWKPCGARILSSGTELICHTPWISREAWLHIIYRPLDIEAISTMEKALRRPLPPDLKEFYFRANGIHVFSDAFAIDGLRKNFARVGDASWQPYSLVHSNLESFPRCPEEYLFFGSYEDGSKVAYVHPDETSDVIQVDCDTGQVLAEWPDFWTWLLTELERVSEHFDVRGRRIS